METMELATFEYRIYSQRRQISRTNNPFHGKVISVLGACGILFPISCLVSKELDVSLVQVTGLLSHTVRVSSDRKEHRVITTSVQRQKGRRENEDRKFETAYIML